MTMKLGVTSVTDLVVFPSGCFETMTYLSLAMQVSMHFCRVSNSHISDLDMVWGLPYVKSAVCGGRGVVRSGWGEGGRGVPKKQTKEQNQVIFDSDKG